MFGSVLTQDKLVLADIHGIVNCLMTLENDALLCIMSGLVVNCASGLETRSASADYIQLCVQAASLISEGITTSQMVFAGFVGGNAPVENDNNRAPSSGFLLAYRPRVMRMPISRRRCPTICESTPQSPARTMIRQCRRPKRSSTSEPLIEIGIVIHRNCEQANPVRLDSVKCIGVRSHYSFPTPLM